MVEETLATETLANEAVEREKELNGISKREREDDEENVDDASKKPKVDDEPTEEAEVVMEDKVEEEKPVGSKLGPKDFESAEAMFNYFVKFLHFWPPNLNINKYEHMVLLDLLKKGHSEAEKKIGSGIEAFQVRYHPMWKSRCFFLIRADGSSNDFSFRKCVDHILPLPEDMKIHHSSKNGNKNNDNKFNGNKFGGNQRGGGGGRGGGFSGQGKREGSVVGLFPPKSSPMSIVS